MSNLTPLQAALAARIQIDRVIAQLDVQQNAAPAVVEPRFDALGRQRWAEAEAVMTEHAEHLARINSRIGTLAYFGDETPTLDPTSYGAQQWRCNVESFHIHTKHNQGYVFVKNGDGQWEAVDAMNERQSHVPTVAFNSRAEANEYLAKWIATQLAIGPRDPSAPDKWTPDDPGTAVSQDED